ncbi:hypothetical protein ACFORO_10470 [Amycolatopsis halotolerans]|uniref:Uncharacterized protein n=1 Tax=Amycolatopsis halotolerans TaxID=330083 RepID=A0ABV7QBB3_9PSEU
MTSALTAGFEIHVDPLAVRISGDGAEGGARHLTVSGQLAIVDAVHAYHDSLSAEELQMLATGAAAELVPALVHVDRFAVSALVVPYEGDRLAAAFASVLAAPGMTAKD